jgi:hypothetical protein
MQIWEILCSLHQRIKNLLNNLTIQRALSGFLLVLFAVSITPKLFLHDLLASHKDNHIRSTCFNAQVAKAEFDCDCDNSVTESPYEYTGSTIPEFIIPVVFLTHQYTIIPFLHSETGYVKGLRGPPVFPI